MESTRTRIAMADDSTARVTFVFRSGNSLGNPKTMLFYIFCNVDIVPFYLVLLQDETI